MKKLVLGVLTMSVLVLAVSVLSEPGIERRPETAAVGETESSLIRFPTFPTWDPARA